MDPEHKKYILENIGQKSVSQIAGDLGIREKAVRKYLDARGLKAGVKTKTQDAAHFSAQSPRVKEAALPIPAGSLKTNIFYIAVILILIFAAYSGALQNGFIWDDEYLIRDNTAIKNFKNAASVFTTYLAATSGNINNFYRPVQELSYMADYRIWGSNPFGYHLTNIVLHALAAVILYFLLLRVLNDSLGAFIAAAIFGIHPVNTEAVTYIAGRADPLFLLFFLLSFTLFLKSTDTLQDNNRFNIPLYTLSLCAYLLAILSKEIALIMPLFLFLYIAVLVQKPAMRKILYGSCLPFCGVALLYVIARSTVLNFSGTAPSSLLAKYSLITRLLTTCKAVCVYISLAVAPFNLHMERVIATRPSFAEPATLGALFAVAALFVITWQSYGRFKKVFFALTWFFLGLLPVSNIVPINSFIAEHWLYLPAIGIFIIAAMALSGLFNRTPGANPMLWKTISVSMVLAIFVFFGVLTFERNKDWKDGVTFFKSTLKYHPKNARLHLNFGNVYFHLGQAENAMAEYKKVLELQPDYPEAYSNIGSIYMKSGEYGKAREYVEKALEQKPDLPAALNMMEIIKEKKNKSGTAPKSVPEASPK